MYEKENCQAIFGAKPIEMMPYSHMLGNPKMAKYHSALTKIFKKVYIAVVIYD